MSSSSSPDKLKLVLAYLLCAVVWGTTWFAIRVCIAPGAYPTVFAAAARFTIASAILLPICLLTRPRSDWPRGKTLGWVLLAGVLDALGYLLGRGAALRRALAAPPGRAPALQRAHLAAPSISARSECRVGWRRS